MFKFLVKVFISLYFLNMLMDQVDILVTHPQTWKFCVKLLVKVFISMYLLNMLMDQVDTLQVDRYWSQVLCCTIISFYYPPL